MFPLLYLWPVLPNTPRVDWLASDHVPSVLAKGFDETSEPSDLPVDSGHDSQVSLDHTGDSVTSEKRTAS